MSDTAPTVFSLPSRIDSNTSSAFEAEMMTMIGSSALIMDFSEVTYISSAGLRVVLLAAKKLKAAGGRFVLCGLSTSVFEVFRVSGFAKILDIVPDLAAAQAKFA